MREIKFEYGFSSINGIEKKKYHLDQIPNIKRLCDLWDELPIVYVREYTGLKDKNGKEIYEGDISEAGDLICVIQWRHCKWVATWKTKRGDERHPNIDFRTHKVIGNIHENPELLK